MTQATPTLAKPLTGNLYFKHPEFDGQFLRLLGSVYTQGADIGECFSTAYKIPEGDFESWYQNWNELAQRVKEIGEKCAAKGHALSASQAFLRACNYFRTAEFFLRENLDDVRILESANAIRECFLSAGDYYSPSFRAVEIPCLNTKLPGYFFQATKNPSERPTLIIVGGYDSYVEEAYFFGAAAALQRGYNVLTFDGPGQGQLLRREKLFFRPDWEVIVKPVVDYALTLPEINPNQIALMGRSFGGYLATRAATEEHRIKALIVDPGQYDLGSLMQELMPAELMRAYNDGQMNLVDQMMQQQFSASAVKRFYFNSRMRTHGVSKVSDYLSQMMHFKVEAEKLKQISCPVAICQPSDDPGRAGQASELFEKLQCPKVLLQFTSLEGAGDHCEAGAPSLFSQRVFDWLDETLAK